MVKQCVKKERKKERNKNEREQTLITNKSHMTSTHHPMINYWLRTFDKYYTLTETGIKFEHPQLKDPIMSPYFVTGDLEEFLCDNKNTPYFNCIGHPNKTKPLAQIHGYSLLKEFSLAVKDVPQLPLSLHHSIQVLPLDEACTTSHFKNLLQSGFPKDFPFLEALLPHLCQSEANYWTLFLKYQGTSAAMLTLGINKELAFALNACVLPAYRGLKLSSQIIQASLHVLSQHSVAKVCFWTQLAQIEKHGDSLETYLIFAKDQP